MTRWSAAWKALAQSLGAARDHDVFRTTLLPGLAALLGPRDAARLQTWARKEGAAATDRRPRQPGQPRLQRAPAGLHTGTVAAQGWTIPTSPSDRLDPVGAQAAAPASSQADAAHPNADLFDPIERHQVRIEAKKLRYALDFLASLWSPAQMAPCSEALAQAQDLLGAMNDLVTAQRLLTTAPRTGANRLQAVLGAQLVESAAHLPAVLKALKQAPVPWR